MVFRVGSRLAKSCSSEKNESFALSYLPVQISSFEEPCCPLFLLYVRRGGQMTYWETVFNKGDQIFRIAVCRIYTVKGPDFRLIIGDNKAIC